MFCNESWQNDICSFIAFNVALTVSFKLISFLTFIIIFYPRYLFPREV